MIDAFVTLGRPSAPEGFPYLTPEALLEDMDRLGIAEAYCTDYRALEYSAYEGNSFISELLENYDRLHPVHVVLPEMVSTELAKNVRLVRAEPLRQGYSMRQWCSSTLWKLLEDRCLPVLLDAGEQWDSLHELLKNHPNLPVIITRTGYRCCRMIYPLLKLHNNLHIDISGFIVNEGLKEVVSLFGAERLIFGTDAPRCASECAVGTLIYSGLSKKDYSLIASENIKDLTKCVKQIAL